ncbi:MAG: MFS transporter [Candidatus Electrothrix aestuarii]|uniref:MFS transporter n=1 Tax=Candidatus Electrothrix aestuarii TaxID=3062594 RepID=A0AAU8LSE1_9BACT|nr:MFS transporter [Candidatus Electrothrix aestuarii]
MQTKKDPGSSGSSSYAAGHFSSYLRLLRQNRNYRRYWLSSCISQIGDWFNYIAIFVLLNQLTGSGKAVSWFLIAKYLPPAVLGPVAGVIADKFSRKKILIICDLMRAGLVLGYLLIRESDYVWLVYVLAFVQESIWTFYHPARQATVPNLCSKEELSIVNGLSGASWSVMLAFGAALGGFFTAHFGWQAAILADCCSFLLSATVMLTVLIPHREKRAPAQFSLARVTGWLDLKEGFAYIKARPKVIALLTVKSGWALSGGILVMLAVFGEQVFAQENNTGQGGLSGILFSMRGLGAALGPIIAWRLFGDGIPAMRKAIGGAFFFSCAAYILFSQAPNMWFAAFWVFLGHFGGSVQWVFSTTLLHRRVEDRFRGRLFSTEMTLMTLMLSLSTWCTGAAMDFGISPRTIVLVLALLFLLPGSSWLLYLRSLHKTGSSHD